MIFPCCLKRLNPRPAPTNISTKSEPKEKRVLCLGNGLGHRVYLFRVLQARLLLNLPPSEVYFSGSLRKDISSTSSLAPWSPATSLRWFWHCFYQIAGFLDFPILKFEPCSTGTSAHSGIMNIKWQSSKWKEDPHKEVSKISFCSS